MALFRFCYDEGDYWLCKEAPFSRDPFTVYMIKRRVRQNTYSHGIGRHSKEEVKPILVEDMNALSTFLGMNTRKYLLCLKRPCIMLILTSYVLLLYVGCTTAQHVVIYCSSLLSVVPSRPLYVIHHKHFNTSLSMIVRLGRL